MLWEAFYYDLNTKKVSALPPGLCHLDPRQGALDPRGIFAPSNNLPWPHPWCCRLQASKMIVVSLLNIFREQEYWWQVWLTHDRVRKWLVCYVPLNLESNVQLLLDERSPRSCFILLNLKSVGESCSKSWKAVRLYVCLNVHEVLIFKNFVIKFYFILSYYLILSYLVYLFIYFLKHFISFLVFF